MIVKDSPKMSTASRTDQFLNKTTEDSSEATQVFTHLRKECQIKLFNSILHIDFN